MLTSTPTHTHRYIKVSSSVYYIIAKKRDITVYLSFISPVSVVRHSSLFYYQSLMQFLEFYVSDVGTIYTHISLLTHALYLIAHAARNDTLQLEIICHRK